MQEPLPGRDASRPARPLFALQKAPPRLCADCGVCAERCPTAFEGDASQKQDCILCMECVRKCAQGRAKFSSACARGP